MNAIRQQLRKLLSVHPRESGYTATLTLSVDFSLLPDHFPGSPILPGLSMVQSVLLATAIQQGINDIRLVVLKNAKMMSPVRPGDRLTIDADVATRDDGDITIKAKLSSNGKRTAEFSLTARAIVVESGMVL